MANSCDIQAYRAGEDLVIVVRGRGTMQESHAAHGVALAAPGRVVMDLSACTYLDSTFLGCLLDLQNQLKDRFSVAAPGAVCQQLFESNRLAKRLTVVDRAPAHEAEGVPVRTGEVNAKDLSRHIMECHRGLAQLGGANEKAFAAIARKLEEELGK